MAYVDQWQVDNADFDLQDTKALEGMAILQENPTATKTISAGQYVLWNRVLYKAKVNITVGTTFAVGTNLEAVANGGLNSLSQQIEDLGPYNGLDSDSTTAALSAAQGKALNQQINTKKYGSAVGITSYNAYDNMYTFPSDGYVTINIATTLSGATVVSVYGENIGNAVVLGIHNPTITYEGTALFVKKGMKCYVSRYTEGHHVTFQPLI